MEKFSLKPFPKNHPLGIGCLFFVKKAESNKLTFPSQTPDLDNFEYAIANALKRTPKKNGRDGKYPNGVLYYDDDQLIWRISPSGMLWATDEHPAGLILRIRDGYEIKDSIESEVQQITDKKYFSQISLV